MQLTLNKQYGPALLNLLRQVAMCSVPTIRPIAFSVGSTSTIIASNDNTIEDMTEFIDNVMKSNYTTQSTEKLIVYEGDVNGTMLVSEFGKVGIETKEDAEILHTLRNVPVRIVFRNDAGNYTAKENQQFLLENSAFKEEEFVCVASRHSDIESYTQKETERNSNLEYNVQIKTFSGRTDREILSLAKQQILNLLSDLNIS